MTTWTNVTASTATVLTWPAISTSLAYQPAAVPERPFAWLDREIERTCALARSS